MVKRPNALIKPTIDTLFHIDYNWWERSQEDLRVYMLSHLSTEQRDRISQSPEDNVIDYIDPDTGEVFQLDELRLAIQTAAEDPEFINTQTSLVDAVFRVFLKNNNSPLSPREIADRIGRPPETILKTFSGTRIYKGIRPV